MTVLPFIGRALVASLLLAAARDGGQATSRSDVLAEGRKVYLLECATCHGEAATGYGPTSWLLRQRPPDLTRFSSRTKPFPRDNIRSVITGRIRLEPSHGPSEMPRWRPPLLEGAPSPTESQMAALLSYLEDIQLRPFGRNDSPTSHDLAAIGRSLFQSHCTTCHGEDGRGPRPSGYVVGISQDLTTLAARNNGVLSHRRVYESIAQCDGSEMPGWQDAFERAGWSRYLVTKQIEALATYVESIQRQP